jgi:CheY-like chemotaxis protein
MYRLRLENAGHTVDVAADGESALKAIRAAPPDLVLLDIGLPKMDGVAVLERLREQAPTAELPVVFLTNYSREEYEHRARDLGARAFLIKAETSPSELVELIPGWVA